MATPRRPSIGVATQLTPAATLAEVAEACRRIDADTSFAPLEQLESGADILIGGLGAGRRLVPDEYLSFVSRRAVDASLLLLCEEALVRPFVSLSQGRITLVDPSCDAETIYHRLRVLLAERAATHGAVEQAAPGWWAADSRSASRARPARGDDLGSLTLAFAFGAASESERSAATIRALDAQSCLEQALSGTLGTDTGVLHFAPGAQEWLVSWPRLPGTLWLLSPLRLPTLSDLSGSHGGRGRTRLAAASGDIALAMSPPTSPIAALEMVQGLAAKARLGGPSVFDAASASLPGPAWVSVVEVR